MTNETVITDLKQVTIRFSGDSGDGMQLRDAVNRDVIFHFVCHFWK